MTAAPDSASPLDLVRSFRDQAAAAGAPEPDAMALATISAEGWPQVRYVLARVFEERALHFFTNYESQKSAALTAHPRAAGVFYWDPIGVQARVEGTVARSPEDVSNRYFGSRPRGHQIAASVSPQSRPLGDLDLVAAAQSLDQRLAGQPIPRPVFWGGFRITVERVEIWRRGADRLHRRTLYTWQDGAWHSVELAP
jgi:pyridoxamine 5'-phosphate oxidase